MLIHQAIREDALSSGRVRIDMPARKFATLDPDPAQFLKPIVDQIADFMSARIDRYNRECGRSLSLSDVRAKLLAVPALYEPAIVLVYATFRCFRLLEAHRGYEIQSLRLC
jgi:hypothetical protein